MKLKALLNGIDYKLVQGQENIEIEGLNYNSREIKDNHVFFCVKGFKTDGHVYVGSAVNNGSKVIVCEDLIDVDESITVIKVEDCRKALALAGSNYYDNPCEKLKLIGITGTNGKTTSAFMMKKVLEEAGFKVGLIGTVANYIGDKMIKTERTTPESLELHKLFNDMVEEKVDYCVMEVSSHSLDLNRVYGIAFSNAIFTNLTQDHLDFHVTMENYFNAKKKLFYMSKNKVVNIDDSYGDILFDEVKGNKISIAIEKPGDIVASNILDYSSGAKFKLSYNGNNENIELSLPGMYNVYNALGVIGVALMEDIDITCIKEGLKKAVVPGRCELVCRDLNLPYEIIVDYAHTPDGLEKILKTAREFTKNRLISVFGCGGDRDKEKRPIMGKIGSDLSDIAIVTSDNPRSEEPIEIINNILKGICKDNYLVNENRREAIKMALNLAKEGDVIVIAGKGHEDYQVLKDKTIHFDEREIIREIISEI